MSERDDQIKQRRGGISVIGSGSVELTPDVAILSVGVSEQAPDLASARQSVAGKATAARDHLLSGGVEVKDLQTSQLSVHTIYRDGGRPGSGGQPVRIIEFQVATTMRAVFRSSITDAQAAIDGLFDVVGEGLELHGLTFDSSQRAEAEVEARRLAYEDARAKAEQLAELAGATLGPVRGIREGESGFGPEPRPMRRAMLAAEASMPIEGGSLTETATVSVRWALI